MQTTNAGTPPPTPEQAASALVSPPLAALHQQLVMEHGDLSVLVDHDFTILHVAGVASPFLRIPSGKPTQSLLAAIHPDLGPALHIALAEAARRGALVAPPPLLLRHDGAARLVALRAQSVAQPGSGPGLLWVRFTELGPDAEPAPAPIVHQPEAELQSANEELLAAREELATSEEELQQWYGAATDIDDIRRAEEALRASEETLRLIADNLPVLIGEHDRELRYRFVNRAFEVFFGVPRETIIGRTVREQVGERVFARLRPGMEAALRGERVRFEDMEPDKHGPGQHSWTEENYFPRIRPDGAVEGFFVLALDITERKRREANLAFLDEINQEFAGGKSRDELIRRVGERLVRHLQLSRCNFSVVDEPADRITTLYDWRRDPAAPSVLGEHRISTFLSEAGRQHYRAGRVSVVNDTTRSPLLSGSPELFQQLGIGSVVDAPFLEYGRWKALLSACRAGPSQWRDDEVELIRDLTARLSIRLEHVCSQEALRESEAQLAMIFERAQVGISEIAPDGRFLRVNPQLCRLLGRTREELLALGVADVTFEEDIPRSIAAVQRLQETGEPLAFDKRYIRPDGTLVWAKSALSLISSDLTQMPAILAVTIDLTEHQHAERTIRETATQLQIAIDAAGMGTWEWDLTTNTVRWNRQHFIMFGMLPNDEPLSLDAFFEHIHPDDRHWVTTQLEQTVQANELFVAEFRALRKDGAIRWMSGYGQTVEMAGGLVTRVSGVMLDITARKEAELALQQANAALETRVAERTAELVVSNQVRQELLRQLVTAQEEERLRIARDLHDQLGQQITGLLLGLKQVAQHVQHTPAAPLLPPLEALALDMAKESHRLAVNLRPTALDDVGLIGALEQHVANWSAQTGIRAEFHSRGLGHARLPIALETTLYRAVQEALTNTGKYAGARTVSVLLERRPGKLVVIVEDDGQGFDPDAAPADDGRPRLGLRGMCERVGQLGGTIEIESSAGSGTTVFVHVPLPADGVGP